MAKGTKRDTTRALECVVGAQNATNETDRSRYLATAAQILRDIDSRTGRKDPSKRRKSAAKSPAKSPPKTAKGGRR